MRNPPGVVEQLIPGHFRVTKWLPKNYGFPTWAGWFNELGVKCQLVKSGGFEALYREGVDAFDDPAIRAGRGLELMAAK